MLRKLLYALFDLKGRRFIESVQLIHQDNAIYCFMFYYIYAHDTKSSNEKPKNTRRPNIASQSQYILAIAPVELIV